ncbi:hypothetical protein GWK47_011892 [Chionoecetes opilio]|uniref:Uncharacterized protein n=1 Tax=Chionoecetes opilio TaxID=41210 RepID=A0A8J5CMA9_CHIOP|nr:hypothetical protein GWK47_011892 [Chionoecetes opilio]
MRQACDMKRRKSEGDQYDWMVDYGFYLDQYKGDRVQTLGPADKKLYLLQKEKDENDRKRAKYHDQQSTSTEASGRSATQEELAACGNDNSQATTEIATERDPEYQPSTSTNPPAPSNITLTLPRKSLPHGSAELAARCKVSHRVATAMTSKFIKLGGGALNQCSVSTSTSHRQRTSAMKDAETRIKQELKDRMPEFMVLHWDGKIIKYETRRETDLAIVVSFPRADLRHQFLAAPCIPDGTGASMRDALTNTIRH